MHEETDAADQTADAAGARNPDGKPADRDPAEPPRTGPTEAEPTGTAPPIPEQLESRLTPEGSASDHAGAPASLADEDPETLALVRAFAGAIMRRVPASRLADADMDGFASEIADAFHFLAGLQPGQLLIRTRTPHVYLHPRPTPASVVQVASPDHPFLFSSVVAELDRLGYEAAASLHPVIGVERDETGHLVAIVPARNAEHREALLHIELDRELDTGEGDRVERCLRQVLQDVLAATSDYERLQHRLERAATQLRALAASGDAPRGSAEAAQLLDWLLDDNFLLLGWREYDLREGEQGLAVHARPDSGLGLLAGTEGSRYAVPVPIDAADEGFRARRGRLDAVTVARSQRFSTVHRRERMVNVWIKEIDEDGTVRGEACLVGLFTERAQSEPSSTVPVLRGKLERILELEDVIEDSHDERALVSLFDGLPKEDLFEFPMEALRALLVELLEAQEQQEVRLASRMDQATQTFTSILSIPRDRYSAALRERVEALLVDRLAGRHIDIDVSLGDRPNAIVSFSVHVAFTSIPDLSYDVLEAEVRALARTWEEELEATLGYLKGPLEGERLTRRVAARLPAGYRESNVVAEAVSDVETLDGMIASGAELRVRLHDDTSGNEHLTRLKIFKAGAGIELSEILPTLESLGLTVSEELPHHLKPDRLGRGAADVGGTQLYLYDYGVHDDGRRVDVLHDAERVAEAVVAAWDGDLAVDTLNRLVLRAGVQWRWVELLRAYRRYRLQVGTVYTSGYQNDALTAHPAFVKALFDYFEARFDPALAASDDQADDARQRVVEVLDEVRRLDEDRILRSFLALVDATLRTNFYREGRGSLALKIDSAAVPRTPKPVPHREIFVYSPRMEGIHLRGGSVARGGIRWSDRRDDFRTEVLGLMQAQVLKNAVIVPTGAKGGFVLTRPPADRSELPGEVRRQYQAYIRALLDVTDDVTAGEVHPPEEVRRRDGDDPYLVVAADRGTATFSDTANALAEEHGFWLGDAFASGGSRGYDHKGLGITARGAWVAVQRHFRELGIDVQRDPFTAIGIGDMSGDVFGNGVLLSPALRLVAAFDHRDIFVDPDPDPEQALAERRRLFALPRSSWQDYDRDAMSAGGGVWARTVKSIPLSKEMRGALRVDDEHLSPPELIQAILRAPVDLLFAGGIGTFVRATTESDDDIGDRANDEVRVEATEVRARVIGEGANLAITQQGRIQYARRGGRVNTDFIDNSAGVDISDHEVNLKILLRLAIERGRMDQAERDELLSAVTDAVVAACLRDVDQQTWVLSQEAARSPGTMEAYEAVMVDLEQRELLDRDVQSLPSTAQMDQRREVGAGLTRPELAVLLAVVKHDVTAALIDSGLPEHQGYRVALESYFPPRLVERLGDLLVQHRLRRELIATVVANDVVNHMGITFVDRLHREVGTPKSAVVSAWFIASQVTQAQRYWDAVAHLEREADPGLALEVKADVDELLETLSREYLRAADLDDVTLVVARDRDAFDELRTAVTQPPRRGGGGRSRAEHGDLLADAGIDPSLARELAGLADLALTPDVASVARAVGRPARGIASAFLVLGEALGLERLHRLLNAVEPASRWARWQIRGLDDDLRAIHRVAAHRALTEHPEREEDKAVEAFLRVRHAAIEHARRLARQVEAESEGAQLEALAVAVRAVRDVLRSLDRRP